MEWTMHESAKIQNAHPEGLNNDETKRASNPASRDWVQNRLQQSEKTKFTRIKVSAYFGTLSVVWAGARIIRGFVPQHNH